MPSSSTTSADVDIETAAEEIGTSTKFVRRRIADGTEQLKTVAAKMVSDEHQLNAFMAIADPERLADENGDIDEQKVSQHVSTLFNFTLDAPKEPEHPGDIGRAALAKRFGVQVDPPAQVKRPGDSARIALKKRFGVEVSPPTAPQGPGDAARAELERRFGAASRPRIADNREPWKRVSSHH